MKITFIKDHKVKQGDGKGPHYKTGETYDLERSYAEKYKRLELAVDYVAPVEAPVEPEVPITLQSEPDETSEIPAGKAKRR